MAEIPASIQTQKCLITSASLVKGSAVSMYFGSNRLNATIVEIDTVDCSGCKLPEQPIIDTHYLSSGAACAKERLNYARKTKNFDNYDYIISIESAITCSSDICFAIVLNRGLIGIGYQKYEGVDGDLFDDLIEKAAQSKYNKHIYGAPVTYGELLQKEYPEIDPKNWMLYGKTGPKLNRMDQIVEALKDAFNDLNENTKNRNSLNAGYIEFPDFPQKGVLFQDIFPLFKSPSLLYKMINFIKSQYEYDHIDYIVGLESRGFCIGTGLAFALKTGFVPIRKVGKLPGKTIKETYEKEYGSDVCEIQEKAFEPGSRVLIVDDLIGTGGTMKAAVNLVLALKGIVVDCCVLKNIAIFKDRCDKCMNGTKYSVLL
jgi:adenine phosphoribosyltransferase